MADSIGSSDLARFNELSLLDLVDRLIRRPARTQTDHDAKIRLPLVLPGGLEPQVFKRVLAEDGKSNTSGNRRPPCRAFVQGLAIQRWPRRQSEETKCLFQVPTWTNAISGIRKPRLILSDGPGLERSVPKCSELTYRISCHHPHCRGRPTSTDARQTSTRTPRNLNTCVKRTSASLIRVAVSKSS